MPQITHRDLVAFAEDRVNLKKSEVDDQRAQVNRFRDLIENKIATTPGERSRGSRRLRPQPQPPR